MKPALLLLPLLAGAALGSAGVWTFRHLPATGESPLVSSPDVSSTTPGVSRSAHASSGLVLPPRLDSAEADAAVTEWLALPALGKDSTPTERSERRARLRALLTRLPDDKLAPLLDAFVTRGNAEENGLRWLTFEILTERDADSAARWAVTQTDDRLGKNGRRNHTAHAVLAWARSDFDPAYAWSIALPDTALADHLAKRLLEQLAATSPQKAIELARARSDEFFKTARRDLLTTWAKQNPADAVRWFASPEALSSENQWPLRQAVKQWIERSPTEAFAWLSGPNAPTDDRGRSLLENMAYDLTTDPKTVGTMADLIFKSEGLPKQNNILLSLIGSWKDRDPKATLAWLDSINGDRRSELIDRVSSQWGFSDPKTSLEFKLRLPEGSQRTDAIVEALANWAKTTPDDALAWLSQHPGQDYAKAGEAVQGVIVGNLAKTDLPRALVQWRDLPDGAAKSAALNTIAEHWSRADPAAAARWFADQPAANPAESATKTNCMAKAVQEWSAKDPESALRWIETLPDQKQRWQVQNSFFNYNRYDRDAPDPVARASLLATVQDKDMRSSMLQQHLSQWMRSDYQSARAWLENSDALTPETTARLLVDGAPYRE